MSEYSRYREALKENFNLLGLAGVVALSTATLNPLPLLVAVVAEAAYLLFVPDSAWYAARLARRYDSDVERQRRQLKNQVLPALRPELQTRFARLEETRRQIDRQPLGDQSWFREVLRKLDYLLDKFLLFASREEEFRRHLESVLMEFRQEAANRQNQPPANRRQRTAPNPAWLQPPPLELSDRWVNAAGAEIQTGYDRELHELRQVYGREADPDTQAVVKKRMEVLDRRREFVGKMAKILINLGHQLQLLEDTFGLINDELRARTPEQLLTDIQEVVGQTEVMSQVLEEITPYEQMASRLGQTVV